MIHYDLSMLSKKKATNGFVRKLLKKNCQAGEEVA